MTTPFIQPRHSGPPCRALSGDGLGCTGDRDHQGKHTDVHGGGNNWTGLDTSEEIMPSHYATYYVKLLDSNGQDYMIHSFQVPVHQNIGALEFGTMERGDKPYRPLMRTPFYRHDDLKRLHTICSRIDDDEITEVEW